jgi:hypothetical protein
LSIPGNAETENNTHCVANLVTRVICTYSIT